MDNIYLLVPAIALFLLQGHFVYCTEDCIEVFQVKALTGTADEAGSTGRAPDLAIQVSGQRHFAGLAGSRTAGNRLVVEIPVNEFDPTFSPSCLTQDDIERVSIVARSSDGWLVASINVTTVSNANHSLLTSNPNLNKFVDTNGEYTYDGITVPLTRPTLGANCINTVKIRAQTGSHVVVTATVFGVPVDTEQRAGFEAENGNSHNLAFQLTNDRELVGELRSPARANRLYQSYLDFAAEFDAEGECVEVSDISQVRLVAGNSNGWLITEIEIEVRVGDDYEVLTSDPQFNLWLDGSNGEQNYDTTQHVLNLIGGPASVSTTENSDDNTPLAATKTSPDMSSSQDPDSTFETATVTATPNPGATDNLNSASKNFIKQETSSDVETDGIISGIVVGTVVILIAVAAVVTLTVVTCKYRRKDKTKPNPSAVSGADTIPCTLPSDQVEDDGRTGDYESIADAVLSASEYHFTVNAIYGTHPDSSSASANSNQKSSPPQCLSDNSTAGEAVYEYEDYQLSKNPMPTNEKTLSEPYEKSTAKDSNLLDSISSQQNAAYNARANVVPPRDNETPSQPSHDALSNSEEVQPTERHLSSISNKAYNVLTDVIVVQ